MGLARLMDARIVGLEATLIERSSRACPLCETVGEDETEG